MKSRREQGFTLIEAAVAIAVVAILSGIVVPLVVKNLNDSRVARAKNDIQVIAAAIASQLKDTARRPNAAGPTGSTGVGSAVWASGPASTALYPTGVTATGAGNNLTSLFGNAGTVLATQTMFFGAGSGVTVASEFGYKGPYLGTDVTAKLDPWGSRYVILGYNGTGQTSGTVNPIWVVCAGPDTAILPANFNGGNGPIPVGGAPVTWTQTAGSVSVDDLIVRVN